MKLGGGGHSPLVSFEEGARAPGAPLLLPPMLTVDRMSAGKDCRVEFSEARLDQMSINWRIKIYILSHN